MRYAESWIPNFTGCGMPDVPKGHHVVLLPSAALLLIHNGNLSASDTSICTSSAESLNITSFVFVCYLILYVT